MRPSQGTLDLCRNFESCCVTCEASTSSIAQNEQDGQLKSQEVVALNVEERWSTPDGRRVLIPLGSFKQQIMREAVLDCIVFTNVPFSLAEGIFFQPFCG